MKSQADTLGYRLFLEDNKTPLSTLWKAEIADDVWRFIADKKRNPATSLQVITSILSAGSVEEELSASHAFVRYKVPVFAGSSAIRELPPMRRVVMNRNWDELI